MSNKSIMWICVSLFSIIGSFIPLLWGDSMLSFSSVFLTAAGGAFGIWVGYKIGNY